MSILGKNDELFHFVRTLEIQHGNIADETNILCLLKISASTNKDNDWELVLSWGTRDTRYT